MLHNALNNLFIIKFI